MADQTPVGFVPNTITFNSKELLDKNISAGVLPGTSAPTPVTISYAGTPAPATSQSSSILNPTGNNAYQMSPDLQRTLVASQQAPISNTSTNNVVASIPQPGGGTTTVTSQPTYNNLAEAPSTITADVVSIGEPKKASSVPPKKASETPAADATEAPREIPCPGCTGNFLYNVVGRLFSSLCHLLQRAFGIRISTTIITYLKERIAVPKAKAFIKGCPVCGGKGTLKDPSDDRAKQKESAKVAKSYAKEIERNEAKLGTGGNRYSIIQNHDYHEVGIGMNDAPSFRVDHDAGWRNWGNADGSVVDPKYGYVIPKGAKANHIQGLVPPMSPGGVYTVKCSNKFAVLAGSHGVEIKTSGPVTIQGGITRITGPEVTVGSSTGKLHLEGDYITMSGKSVEVAPTDGHFYVRGTISNSGNLMIGGHSHLESASVVKLETTGKDECSKVSASCNPYGGPAFWGGLENEEGAKAGLKSLLTYTLSNTLHPEHAKLIVGTRYTLGIVDELLNTAYLIQPKELVKCGFVDLASLATVLPALQALESLLLPVYLFPHVHALPDMMHTHETRIPDIKCEANSGKQLRKAQVGVSGPAPLPKRSVSGLTFIQGVIDTLRSATGALGALLTGTYKKKG